MTAQAAASARSLAITLDQSNGHRQRNIFYNGRKTT